MLTTTAEGLWTSESAIRLPGGVHMPTRMTVARLEDGTLWVHSPNTNDAAVHDAVARFGDVAHIVASSRLHHLFVGSWLSRFPRARAWAAPGLREKRADIAWTDDLSGDEAQRPWRQVLDEVFVDGAPSLGETVFLHRPSGSLLVTDLLFHLAHPQGVASHLVFSMMGVRGRVAQSRAWRFSVKDRSAARSSAERIVAWNSRRLVPAHGEVLEDDAGLQVRDALGWMLHR